ncbi:MAG: ABC transporter permease [Acidobacteria bacterium]|nr:ABC transporter permease [Acidobacteriota bacterium]
MRTILQDLRYGLRFFLGSPGLTTVAVVTLALGIAANTTVFSWIDALLLHPFPGVAGERLAVLESVSVTAPSTANRISLIEYEDYRDNLRSVEGLVAHREEVFTLGEDGANPQAVWGQVVSPNFFSMLGVESAAGRVFAAAEDAAQPVVVISWRLWRTRFHSDARLIGKTIRVNRRDLVLLGVANPKFRGTLSGLAMDLWIPMQTGREIGIVQESDVKARDSRSVYVLARLKEGVTVAQANAEAVTMAASRAAEYPKTNRGISAAVLPVWRFHSGAADLLYRPLWILMALAVLVLCIASANVANLLLARAVARRKEMGIRLALGADYRRLVGQLLTETSLLAVAGALLGILMTFWMADLLPALIPPIHAPVAMGFHPGVRVMLFTAVACVLATMLSGAAPALYWMRMDVNESLKEGGRGGSQGAVSHRMRDLLIGGEVALAAVALIGAGLFLRSFEAAREIHPGFERAGVELARFYLSGSGLTKKDLQSFTVRLRERIAGNWGVESVAFANDAPLGSGAGPYTNVEVDGYMTASGLPDAVNNYRVTPGFFSTLRIPLLEGRDFRLDDDAKAPPVVIVNEAFARRYFRGANPVGRKVRCFGKVATVIGLAKDGRYFHVAEAARPHLFAPLDQKGGMTDQVYAFFKVTGPPDGLRSRLRREVATVEPRAGAFDLMTLQAWTEVTLIPQTVAAGLLAALAGFAMALAAAGLYSVMAYGVTQRTREIGIRMALGARVPNVLGTVMQWGMSLAVAGLVVGTAVGFAVFRLVGSMLIEVSPTDWRSFAGAAAVLLMVAAVACYLPARRAAQIDPMEALRGDS